MLKRIALTAALLGSSAAASSGIESVLERYALGEQHSFEEFMSGPSRSIDRPYLAIIESEENGYDRPHRRASFVPLGDADLDAIAYDRSVRSSFPYGTLPTKDGCGEAVLEKLLSARETPANRIETGPGRWTSAVVLVPPLELSYGSAEGGCVGRVSGTGELGIPYGLREE